MRRVVILGTGTNVGKTYVAAALARALRAQRPNATVLALKPIESGVSCATSPGLEDRGPPIGSDASELARASNVPLPETNPLYALPDPLSPHLAARRAGVSLSVERVFSWLRCAEQTVPPSARFAYLIVETAGGVFTPITNTATNFDLGSAIPGAIWILVAPDSLGVLHDVAATCLALRSLGRSPDYLVISQCRPADLSTGTNLAELQSQHPNLPMLAVPRGSVEPLLSIARALSL